MNVAILPLLLVGLFPVRFLSAGVGSPFALSLPLADSLCSRALSLFLFSRPLKRYLFLGYCHGVFQVLVNFLKILNVMVGSIPSALIQMCKVMAASSKPRCPVQNQMMLM